MPKKGQPANENNINEIIENDDNEIIENNININEIIEENNNNEIIEDAEQAEFERNLDVIRFDAPIGQQENIIENAGDENNEKELVGHADFYELKSTTLDSIKKEGSKLFSKEGLYINESGHPYRTEEEFSEAITDPKNKGMKFFMFMNKNDTPYCLKVENGKVLMSEAPIGVDNQLGDHLFEPKPSLKITDIIKPQDTASEINQIKDKLNDVKKIAKNPDGYIRTFRDAEKHFQEIGYEEIRKKTAALRGEDENTFAVMPQKPVKPDAPTKPSFGIGGWLWRIFVQIVSIGFAETKGYKDHLRALEQYKKDTDYYNNVLLPKFEADNNAYKNAVENFDPAEYEAQKKIVDDEFNKQLQELHKKTETAVKRTQNIETEQQLLTDRAKYLKDNIDLIDGGLRLQLKTYQFNIEVKLEGVADLRRTGKISADNIFANNWLQSGALKGLKYAELTEEDKDTLAGYVASKMAEEKIINAALSNSKYYQGEVSTLIASLNNGNAAAAIKESPEFQEIVKMKAEENAKVMPDTFINLYRTMIRSKNADLKDPLVKLQLERDGMIEKFGIKQVDRLDEKDLIEFARFASVTAEIKRLTDKKNQGKPFDENDTLRANEFVQELHINPNALIKGENSLTNWSGMHKQEMVTDIRNYMSKSYRKAFDTVTKARTNKAVDLEELSRRIRVARDPSLNEQPKAHKKL